MVNRNRLVVYCPDCCLEELRKMSVEPSGLEPSFSEACV
jgi:hypothetical protein